MLPKMRRPLSRRRRKCKRSIRDWGHNETKKQSTQKGMEKNVSQLGGREKNRNDNPRKKQYGSCGEESCGRGSSGRGRCGRGRCGKSRFVRGSQKSGGHTDARSIAAIPVQYEKNQRIGCL